MFVGTMHVLITMLIVHLVYGDVKVAAYTEAVHPYSHLLSARRDTFHTTSTLSSLDVGLLSELIFRNSSASIGMPADMDTFKEFQLCSLRKVLQMLQYQLM